MREEIQESETGIAAHLVNFEHRLSSKEKEGRADTHFDFQVPKVPD